MLGDIKKTTKKNLLKGIPWRFGPNWPGKRCEAKTKNDEIKIVIKLIAFLIGI